MEITTGGKTNYIRDLKMNKSQEEIEHEEYSIFTFNLYLEFGFQQ